MARSPSGRGAFESVEDAVAIAVADLMAINFDDLAWAKPYVDAARPEVEQGKVVSLEDAIADMDAHLASLRR